MQEDNKLFEGDTPWDLLLQCSAALQEHAQAMRNIITVHNKQQTQVNHLEKELQQANNRIQNLNNRITQIERRLHEIG